MSLLIANRPPAKQRERDHAGKRPLGSRGDAAATDPQSCHDTIGAKSSALVTFENVAIPSSTAATTSLRPLKSQRMRAGDCSGLATSL